MTTKGIGLSDVQREERKVVDELRERVVELEKRLAVAEEAHILFRKLVDKSHDEAEKHEAVLREALEEVKGLTRKFSQTSLLTINNVVSVALEVK